MLARYLANWPETLTTWLIIALLLPGLLVLVALVLAFLVSRRKTEPAEPAPGYYHVLGIDRDSGGRREATFHADSEQAARGRAAMDGIIVTEIRLAKESD